MPTAEQGEVHAIVMIPVLHTVKQARPIDDPFYWWSISSTIDYFQKHE